MRSPARTRWFGPAWGVALADDRGVSQGLPFGPALQDEVFIPTERSRDLTCCRGRRNGGFDVRVGGNREFGFYAVKVTPLNWDSPVRPLVDKSNLAGGRAIFICGTLASFSSEMTSARRMCTKNELLGLS